MERKPESDGAPIRVVLIEDHQLVREGVVAILSTEPDIEVVGQAATGEQGLEMVMALRPDIVIMDITLPDVDGLHVTRRLTSELPDTKVLVVSMHDDAATVDQALRAGAKGYVLKGQGVHALRTALRAVAAGGAYLSPEVSRYVIQGYLNRDANEADCLTQREREVLALIAQGLTSAEVADRLGLKTKTVQNHRTNLMEKLAIHTTAGLVRFAMRTGLTR